MSSVIIVANPVAADGRELVAAARTWLRDAGHDAWVDTGTSAADPDEPGDSLGAAPAPDGTTASPLTAADRTAAPLPAAATGTSTPERTAADADMMLALGGDGTMLRAVRLLDGAAVPILGINLGSLGYLTEVEPSDMTAALQRYFDGSEAGRWELDERLMLDVTLQRAQPDDDGPPTEHRWRALNECVVDKELSGHTIRLLARIDGEPFTSYAADGLIVATPTGSTAYSLSARGPIVSPRHRALLLTPVAPHMLFDRSLVLDPSETIDIEVLGARRAALAIDGRRVATLGEHDVVHCEPSAATARFVRFTERRYHQILKVKFGLEDR